MTKQKRDSAVGASRTEAPAAASSKAATDLTAAIEKLLANSQHLDSAALRDALLDLHEFWLTAHAAQAGLGVGQGIALVKSKKKKK
jgi:[protein-PII] uridylyltransferase